MSYVVMLSVMSWIVIDMAYQFSYSNYSCDRIKRDGSLCEEGEELSKMVINVPKRPQVDGWRSIFFFMNDKPEQKIFSFQAPFKGSIIENARPCAVESWWHKGKRPTPDQTKKGAFNAGFEISLLIDRQVEYRGIGIYAVLLNWMQNNSDFLDGIAKKSSGYLPQWKGILEMEIEYLSSTTYPVIPYEIYKEQKLF